MKVSFIVRAYNAEATIRRTLESVLAQKGVAEFEIVVVDDGSTDATASVVTSIGDDHVKLVQQKNGGIVAAGNVGLAAAQGEIVMYLDADDEAHPGFASAAVTALAGGAEYAYGPYVEEYMGEKKNVDPSTPFQAPIGAFAWRREPFAKEGGFGGGTIFPEYDILLRTWGTWRGVLMSEPTFVYHRRQGSLSTDANSVAKAISEFEKTYPQLQEQIKSIRPYAL